MLNAGRLWIASAIVAAAAIVAWRANAQAPAFDAVETVTGRPRLRTATRFA